ncbi:MAG: hypothetical protein A2848_00195 [Candidatus Magasanikbacteria bacterium RIFCSPHIGHO2_01_FULL_50_8]|uniref:Uncharacterized protein n=1 Tax=Candidatus Magasanikbacteria bacterium RIFCSPHIGHO2_01_FULL_50_8 TaxID=1798674 RepID=A0A1F6LN08_9BACT|nr:MAG: hypothetical protein A2848_00195 [Candidatus Magasanikbacteria bacterium RIFCSPHIGHO2_01_FULL_50_8]
MQRIIPARRENGKVFGFVERWGLTNSQIFVILLLKYLVYKRSQMPACGLVSRRILMARFLLTLVLCAMGLAVTACSGAAAGMQDDKEVQAALNKLPPLRQEFNGRDERVYRSQKPSEDPKTTDQYGNRWNDLTVADPNIITVAVFQDEPEYDVEALTDYLAKKGYRPATGEEMRLLVRDFVPCGYRNCRLDTAYVFDTDGSCFRMTRSQYTEKRVRHDAPGFSTAHEQHAWMIEKLPSKSCGGALPQLTTRWLKSRSILVVRVSD